MKTLDTMDEVKQWMRGNFIPKQPDRLHLIAAEIARKIPEMARDSIVNNETLIYNILKGD